MIMEPCRFCKEPTGSYLGICNECRRVLKLVLEELNDDMPISIKHDVEQLGYAVRDMEREVRDLRGSVNDNESEIRDLRKKMEE